MYKMPIIEVNNYEELKEIINNEENKDVMVDFYAEWCRPCIKMLPIFKNVSDKYSSVIFVKINVDNAEDAAEQCNISSIPNILYYKNKIMEPLHNKKGAMNEIELDALIDMPKITDDF